jgi:hypothetical protein
MKIFDVTQLSVRRLLESWRWLCPGEMRLVARNFYGDLFLTDDTGQVCRLDLASGRMILVSDSVTLFESERDSVEKREEWFHESEMNDARGLGFDPNDEQCIGFKVPVMFAESYKHPNNAYIADLYEYVSFSGDVHQQISHLPDGTKATLRVK